MDVLQPQGIEFTQYMLPDGRKRQQWISRSPEIEHLAALLRGAGCVFEIEVLRTGLISMSVERLDKDGEVQVLSQKICMNGLAVPAAVDEMVQEANRAFNDLHL